MAPRHGASWHYDMELAINLAALEWGMRVGEFVKLPRAEQVAMIATVKAKHDMEFVNVAVT